MMEEIRDALEYRPPPGELRDGRTQLVSIYKYRSTLCNNYNLKCQKYLI